MAAHDIRPGQIDLQFIVTARIYFWELGDNFIIHSCSHGIYLYTFLHAVQVRFGK